MTLRAATLAVVALVVVLCGAAGACAPAQASSWDAARGSLREQMGAVLSLPTVYRSSDPQHRWKSFDQLAADLESVVQAGYTSVVLFDLISIRDYPDPRYVPLVRGYAERGIEISVYAQYVQGDQAAVDLVQALGASTVIVYDRELLTTFRGAGIRARWWSAVGYPLRHPDVPSYLGWPDLRSEQIRAELASWAATVPAEVDGGLSLDYIRWNEVGAGRDAAQVTDLAQRIRANWNALGRGELSAAVYPYLGESPADGGALAVGQRWNEWLAAGLIDYAYPMAYESDALPHQIEEWATYDRSRIIPCLSLEDFH